MADVGGTSPAVAHPREAEARTPTPSSAPPPAASAVARRAGPCTVVMPSVRAQDGHARWRRPPRCGRRCGVYRLDVTAPRPVSTTAPPLPGVFIMGQRWADLVFLHWRVPVADVEPLVPRGCAVDTYDGDAWVGLIPFRLLDAAPGRLPGVPWLGSFVEWNVRTYTVDAEGRRDVSFCSLDAQRLAVVLGARAVFALPYMWARMRASRHGDLLRYSSRRWWPGPRGAASSCTVRLGGPHPTGDPLAQFLTARFGLHTRIGGRLVHVPNTHAPWVLHDADLLQLDDGLLAAAGLPGLAGRAPDSVLASPGVVTHFGAPVPATAVT